MVIVSGATLPETFKFRIESLEKHKYQHRSMYYVNIVKNWLNI